MIGTILTLAAAGFVALVMLSLCRIAAQADRNMERNMRDYEARKKRADGVK